MVVGSLFAGIGGIDLGFKQAGFKVAWANEIDKYACSTYRYNFPNTLLIESSIQDINFEKLEKVDVLVAGFPCQPFSVCGKQRGFSDERGNLFFEIIRAVNLLHPSVIFLENVANLAEHDEGRTFNVIYNELASRDYAIRYLIADACDYGVPQHRTRIYIVAFKDIESRFGFSFPKKQPLEKHIFDVIEKNQKSDESLYLPKDSRQYQKMIKAIDDEDQIYRFSDYGIQKSKDGICFTLKANMGTWYDRIPIIKDNYGIRKISPLECLSLQGFPKEFRFPEIPTDCAYKLCGNSVVVPVIAKIAKNIGSSLSL